MSSDKTAPSQQKTYELVNLPRDRKAVEPLDAQSGDSRKGSHWDDPARYFVKSLKPTKRTHNWPPNRFNMPPGPEWDGIDRSNGFERDYLRKKAQEQLKKEQEYREHYVNM